MMVRQSMGLPGQYKMPLDPDYESDYDSDDDEDENPKDPYVNTCFCCCNLGIGVILGALFFLVSQIFIFVLWLHLAAKYQNISAGWKPTQHVSQPQNQPRPWEIEILLWLTSRWVAAISVGDLAGDYYRCHEKKKRFFQPIRNEIMKP